MIKRPFAAAAVLALLTLPCAVLAVPVTLGDAGNYTLLATGTAPGGSLILGSAAEIYGNVGARDYLGMAPLASVHGDADYGFLNAAPSASITGTSTVQSGSAFWDALQADLTNASTAAYAYTGVDKGSVTSTQTFDSYGALSVFDIDGLQLGNGNSLTLKGSSTDQFIVNVGAGGFILGGGAAITLDGVDPGNVLFNIGDSTGPSLAAGTAQGIFISPNGSFTLGDGLTLPGASFLGSGINGNLQIVHGAGDGTPRVPVPEPTGLPLLALGLAIIAGLGWRRRKASAQG